jgi:hypothetical protein
MRIFQHNHWWQEVYSFIYDDTDGHISKKKEKEKVDCRLFLFTRSKHKNYRLFDLLENNDSCYTLIYCFHDKKTSCKTRQEHISYQFTSDRSFFLLRLSFFFIGRNVIIIIIYVYIYIYVNIYKKKKKTNGQTCSHWLVVKYRIKWHIDTKKKKKKTRNKNEIIHEMFLD